MKQLNIQDAGFIYQETQNTPMHICGIGIYDKSTTKKSRPAKAQILEYIEARIHTAPILKQKLFEVPGNWDRPYWIEDEKFDLDQHIYHHGLPVPGDEKQLNELISRLISQPLDMTRPLWECHIIEGINAMPAVGKNSFAIVTKVHHSCVDGSSGNSIITVLHDLEPDGKPMTVAPTETDELSAELPGKYEMIANAYAHNMLSAFQQTRSVAKHLPSFANIAADLYKGKIESGAKLSVPATRFNKTPSTQRVFTCVDFDLGAIKEVKNAQGVTVNDVMVCIVAGGLRAYLDEIGELPDEPLGAMLPKNIRKGDEAEAKSGNQVGGLMTVIHTDIADPVERLKTIHKSIQKAKLFSEMANTDVLFPNLMGGFLYPRTGKALARWAQKKGVMEKIGPLLFNTVITNVPGPDFNLYHDGSKMTVFSGTPPLPDGIGLGHAVYSYCGRISLSVISCPKMLNHPSLYAKYLNESFETLYKEALNPSEKKADKPPRKRAAKKSSSSAKVSTAKVSTAKKATTTAKKADAVKEETKPVRKRASRKASSVKATSAKKAAPVKKTAKAKKES